jgi:hypothetical protein
MLPDFHGTILARKWHNDGTPFGFNSVNMVVDDDRRKGIKQMSVASFYIHID